MSMPHGKDGVGSEDFRGSDYPDFPPEVLDENDELRTEVDRLSRMVGTMPRLVLAVREYLDWKRYPNPSMSAELRALVEGTLLGAIEDAMREAP